MIRDRECGTGSVGQGSLGLPHLGDGKGQVPEGVKGCGAVATLAAGQRTLQLPNEEVWWGGTEQSETPDSLPCPQSSPVLPPPALLTADAAVLPLLVPPPHLPALLVITARTGTQQGTEHGLGDTSPATQPRGTRVVTAPGAGLEVSELLWGLYLREVIQGVGAGPRPHQHSVHLAVQPVQQEPQELLCILLAARHKEWPVRGCRGLSSPQHPAPTPPLLVANKAWGVSLDLRLELGRAHALVGGRGPEQLNQLCKLCRQRGSSAAEVAWPYPARGQLRATLWGLRDSSSTGRAA